MESHSWCHMSSSPRTDLDGGHPGDRLHQRVGAPRRDRRGPHEVGHTSQREPRWIDREIHDRIRGRAGSFDRAMRALALFDHAARTSRANGDTPLPFGVDGTVVRSAFAHMDEYCTTIAPQFPEMQFIWLAAAMPIGAQSTRVCRDRAAFRRASGPPGQYRAPGAPSFPRPRLGGGISHGQPAAADAARSHRRRVHPGHAGGAGQGGPSHGDLRGHGGEPLVEPPIEVWHRAIARWSDPYVAETLSGVNSMAGWAEATRRIDYRFGTDHDRARIDRRPPFLTLAHV